MSLATELTFRNAVLAAESARQTSKAAAFTTYAYDPANLAAYKIAIADADAAYYTSVNSANGTLDLQIGNLGLSGAIPGAAWTPLITMA